MKHDIVEVCIAKSNGEILYDEFFNKISDNVKEKQKLIQLFDNNKGTYEIEIKHYCRE